MSKLRILLCLSFLISLPIHAETGLTKESLNRVKGLYQGQLLKLSPEGKVDFKRGQDEWNVFVNKFCNKDNLLHRYKTAEECQLEQYKEREETLKGAVQTTAEGLIIRRAEHFDTHIVDINDRPDDVDGIARNYWPSQTNVAWPQIDNASNEGHRSWNKLMAKEVYFDDEVEGRHCDLYFNYKIVFTKQDLISASFDNGGYCHGAAHGWGGTGIVTRILSLDRALKAEDLFNDTARFIPHIKELAIKSLNEQGKDGSELNDRAYLNDLYSNVGRWGITEKGITINFGALQGYAGGQHIALISWDDLKPFLKSSSIISE